MTFGGYILGHVHKGRPFLSSVHGTFASILFIPIVSQLVLGIYLKLHIHEKSLRPYAVIIHGIIGKIYPILGWTQMLFGVLTFRGYCREDNLGKFFSPMLHLKLCLLLNNNKILNRSMSCSLFHGQWLHCIRHDLVHNITGWRAMGSSQWKKS